MEKEARRMKNEQCRIKCDQTDYISARQKDGNGVCLVLKQLLWLGPSVRDENLYGTKRVTWYEKICWEFLKSEM